MRESRREKLARRHEAWALQWSEAGEHPWAIDEANEAVQLWAPVAEEHPAAMARALATRASCLHARGRETEVVRDVEESLRYAKRAYGGPDHDDLARAAAQLDRAGRTEAAFATVERLIADARAAPGTATAAEPAGSPPGPLTVHGDLLLRHGRVEEAVVALREACAAAPAGSYWWARARVLLSDALAEAGRLDELREHAERDLPAFAALARLGGWARRLYLQQLETLQRHGIASDRLPSIPGEIEAQRRKLERQDDRRMTRARRLAVLTGRWRNQRDEAGRARKHAVEQEAEAAVERARETGDAHAQSQAWGELAQTRWHNGGRRSAALDAQREALAAARRWSAERPDEARAALVLNLRRFADFAGAVGLDTDARAARAEADDLER